MEEPSTNFLEPFLARRDVACPACGYNLRDLRGQRCPECGDELKLSVGLAEPKQAAGFAGLVGLAAGAGMSGLLLGYLFIRRIAFRDSLSGTDSFLVLTVGGLIVEGVALCIWLRLWRRIRQLSPGARWASVGACWLLTLANLMAFSWNVR